MKLPYNPNDKNSIIEFAKLLKGNSLREICLDVILEHNYSGKGSFGQLLEKFYFLYQPNSDSEADFATVGLELKSTPLKRLKNEEYRSKERLVLNIINYMEVVQQDFETSSFWKKNAALLLVFYLHDSDTDILDYVIKLVDEWNYPNTDLIMIKKDWEFIKQKIVEGKAHELSEGDTFYLGACTKGANASSVRSQPYSDIKAKQRAYSLKQGYVNHIIASIAGDEAEVFGKLIPEIEEHKKQTIEEVVFDKFQPYYGKSINKILKDLNLVINRKAKGYLATLTKAILLGKFNKEIEEFEKAEIIIKTALLKENNQLKESMSFSAFEFTKLVQEKTWEESSFFNVLEHKFLFVFFQYEGSKVVFRKVKFWNMPYKDKEEVKKVWARTKEIISKGEIVQKIVGNKRYTNFPGKKYNKVSHIRPHGRDAKDTYPLPIIEKLTQKMEYSKQCFWLNNNYIRDEIYLK